MFFTKDQYKKNMNDFLKNHHGVLTKLSDDDGKIFGYIFRAEANVNDFKYIVFSVVPDIFYCNGNFKPSTTCIKYYGIQRVLNKWKKVKPQFYLDLEDCINEEFLNSIKDDINELDEMYKKMNINYNFNVDKIALYVHKNLKAIKEYYKNKSNSNIKIIFL